MVNNKRKWMQEILSRITGNRYNTNIKERRYNKKNIDKNTLEKLKRKNLDKVYIHEA